jgi:hypothetical protein
MTNYAGVAVMVCVLAPTTVVGFSLVGQRWTTDVVPVELQLGDAAGLVDGSADWDMCARQSLAAWNAALQTTAMRFTAVRGMSRPPAAFDGINSIVFAADVFGTPFGPSLVSATQTFAMVRDGVDETIEADVLVNQAQPFNCYRGAMQPGPVVYDLQRTVTHALGHVIGLGHPDAAGQTVAALMNAELDAVDVLQANDIEGALTLAGGALVGIPFPPRNEAFTFYESLETEYRDTLQRSQTNEGYVDAEGSAVWFPEWLRYVLNGCEATEATTRVLMQIRGQGIQPVCRDVALDSYAFPPRNLSLDFLEALDAFYRDELQRRVELSHVNLEGKAVWLQEYLRYRVDGVSDADARSQVLTQIQEAAAPDVEACPEMDPAGEMHPIYDHRVQRATSENNPTVFQVDETILLPHASVPDAVIRPDGSTWLYYVNGQPNQHGPFIAELGTDGLFQEKDCVRVDGLWNGNMVDPDIRLTSDGRYRLFYYEGHFVNQSGPPDPDAKHPFYSAISTDGIHFEREALLFEFDDIATDPTAVELANGSWLLAGVQASVVFLATSTDGISYTMTSHTFDQGIPELAVFPNGDVRLYQSGVPGARGMVAWLSQDNGETWTQEGNTGVPGADPSLVHEADGSYTMYFKTFEPGGE